jgi:hypothetical protein
MTTRDAVLLNVQLPSGMFWRIRKKDPSKFVFTNTNLWPFVNPVLYSFLIPNLERRIYIIAGMHRSSILIETSTLIFESPFDTIAEAGKDLRNRSKVETFSSVSKLLETLRLSSNQASISRNPFSMFISELTGGHLPIVPFPKVTRKNGSFSLESTLETAVTWEHLRKADNLSISVSEKIYDTILLDAIQAYISSDYRTAIMYSAVAIETAARTVLDEKYKELLQLGDRGGRLRIVQIPQGGGEFITKDPVFEYMMEGDHFLKLIHQIPLYLIGRSMLLEKQPLYQRAHKLYGTRNKIVHQGNVGNSVKVLPIDKSGASEAIDCAINTFQWFGLKPMHKIPSEKPILLDEVAIHSG